MEIDGLRHSQIYKLVRDMWFKKHKVTKEPYEYNKNVPFEVAFKALREGYTIKHSNCDACLKYLNGRIYEMMDR